MKIFLETGQQDSQQQESNTLLLCDWCVLQARKLLNGGSVEACVAHDLQQTLHARKRLLSDAHPSVWEHMTVLAIVLHKCTDCSAAAKVMQQVVESQASVLLDVDAQLLYNQQYLIHLAFSCKPPNKSVQLGDSQVYKLAVSADNVCARAVAGRNLLLHLSDHAAAVQCLLPVFRCWCIDSGSTRCKITESCLRMLMVALLELCLLEECESVVLAVLQKLGTQQYYCTQSNYTSLVHLTCLAVHNFSFHELSPIILATDVVGSNHLTQSAWRLLTKTYLKAGLLLEAGAACSMSGHDVESQLIIKGAVLCETGNYKVCVP